VYICKQQGIGDPKTRSTVAMNVYALVRIIVLGKPNLLNLLVDSTSKQVGSRRGGFWGDYFRLIFSAQKSVPGGGD
jgi:type IV secretory pathway VirB3-like protein